MHEVKSEVPLTVFFEDARMLLAFCFWEGSEEAGKCMAEGEEV